LVPAARTPVSSMSVARRETSLLLGQPPNGPRDNGPGPHRFNTPPQDG
jgi:hypothetical protein